MKNKRLLVSLYLVVLLLSLTACSPSSQAGPKEKSTNAHPYLPAGWEALDLEHRYTWFEKNRGKLAEVYDEFVGALIDDGLDIRQARWLKPLYGNGNMLWLPDARPGKQRQHKLTESKTQFPPKLYTFLEGDLQVADTAWQYVGYAHNTDNKMEPFQLTIFVCGDQQSGVSLFYWGGDKTLAAHKSQETLSLLSELSKKCN